MTNDTRVLNGKILICLIENLRQVSCLLLLPSASYSNALPGRVAGSPRPLKVMATELAGNVDYLADEIKAGDAFHFH